MMILITGKNANVIEKAILDNFSQMDFDILMLPYEDGALSYEMYQADCIICNGLFLYHDISDFPNLKFVQLLSAGYDRFPIDKSQKRKIFVRNAADTYAYPMAEFVLCKILDIYKNSRLLMDSQSNHHWNKNLLPRELMRKNVFILGFGNLGFKIAQILSSFDLGIFAFEKTFKNTMDRVKKHHISELPSFIHEADIVVVCLPLVEETNNLLDFQLLSKMKDDSVLINVSRGKVLDQEGLIKHLQQGKFLGVALAVFHEEPLSEKSELWDFKNVYVSSHISYLGAYNIDRLTALIVKNLHSFFEVPYV